jgi:hypothetical protein
MYTIFKNLLNNFSKFLILVILLSNIVNCINSSNGNHPSSNKYRIPTLYFLLYYGIYTNAGSMTYSRSSHTANLLEDGTILLIGGSEILSTDPGEIYDPGKGKFNLTGNMIQSRSQHTSTVLEDGRVLVAGGTFSGTIITGNEVYSPDSKLFATTGVFNGNRYNHTATLLNNGKVLICGGYLGSSALNTAELFDPSTNTFSSTGNMSTARRFHTATLLPNGKVLIVGGVNYSGSTEISLSSTEFFDPNTGTFSAGPNLNLKRYHHTATSLPNGYIYIIGGKSDELGTSSVELYSYSQNEFKKLPSLQQARYEHEAIRLPNGKLLITGGKKSLGETSFAILKSTEIWNETLSKFLEANSMRRSRSNHTLTLTQSGRVFLAGGDTQKGQELDKLQSTELYRGESMFDFPF